MTKRKGGRVKLSHRIHTRITPQKYEELTRLLEQSQGLHSHSELLRHILDNKEIKVKYYDTSLDKTMEELSAVRKELQAIGININQVVRRFHTEQFPESRFLQAMELVKLFQQSDLKVTYLFNIIARISEQWLPE